jgi:hypothetical protein
VDAYVEDNSSVSFCRLQTFEDAWFAFVRLQELASIMQCSTCGPNPTVVIADGIAVSFPSHRVESLQPPTLPAKDQSWVQIKRSNLRSTGFPGQVKLRKMIHSALTLPDGIERVQKLSEVMMELQTSTVIVFMELC